MKKITRRSFFKRAGLVTAALLAKKVVPEYSQEVKTAPVADQELLVSGASMMCIPENVNFSLATSAIYLDPKILKK